jgi:hypothetical protein
MANGDRIGYGVKSRVGMRFMRDWVMVRKGRVEFKKDKS